MRRADLIAEFRCVHGRIPDGGDFEIFGMPITAAELAEIDADKALMESIAAITDISEKVAAIQARKKPEVMERLLAHVAREEEEVQAAQRLLRVR